MLLSVELTNVQVTAWRPLDTKLPNTGKAVGKMAHKNKYREMESNPFKKEVILSL